MVQLLALAFLATSATSVSAQVQTLQSIVQAYGLTAANFDYSFPSQALQSEDAYDYIKENWDLTSDKIDYGVSDIAFTADPSTVDGSGLVRRQAASSSTRASRASSSASATGSSAPITTSLSGEDPVFRVGYPEGSYSGSTGGTQFYSQALNTSDSGHNYERMLLSYDVWFPQGYAWNRGGKLPGLRGGPDARGCSGGEASDGESCFSTRLMWRTGGAGEVYAYVPTSSALCEESSVMCNSDDYGTSLARGSFSFQTGQWQSIWLLVMLNEVGTQNGVIELWYNGVPALNFTNVEIRKSDELASIGGLYFSTFFGGDDSTWATPTDQYSYYKNMQLFAGTGAATGEGRPSGSSRTHEVIGGTWAIGAAAMLVAMGLSL